MEEEKADFTEESPQDSSSDTGKTEDSGRDSGKKWQLALSYLPLICLIPLFLNRDDDEIQHHAKQGFILFLIILFALLLKIDAIWNLIILVALAASLVGAIGMLTGSGIKLPFLKDLADKFKI
ncbi:hypothetical protein ISS30_10455 [bacterium]|nr:hypothetical protein [bacterium]